MHDFDWHIVLIPWLHIFLLACGVIILSSYRARTSSLCFPFLCSKIYKYRLTLPIQCCMFLTHQTASQEYIIWSKCSIEHFAWCSYIVLHGSGQCVLWSTIYITWMCISIMLLQRRSNMHADMHELYQILELIKESVLHGRRLWQTKLFA